MTWLAIDTATPRLSVAARCRGRVAGRHLDGPRQHARALLALVEEVLAELGTALPQVEAVVVADGPGSFTGLRVGAAVAKALHDARGIPVYVAASLKASAAAAREIGEVLVTADALRGEVYAAVYAFDGAAVRTLAAPRAMDPAAARALVPSARLLHDPHADARNLLALADIAGGLELVADAAAWVPTYGRPAEAQARWEQAHGRPLSAPPRLAG